jgi:hypothetical protein
MLSEFCETNSSFVIRSGTNLSSRIKCVNYVNLIRNCVTTLPEYQSTFTSTELIIAKNVKNTFDWWFCFDHSLGYRIFRIP